MEKIITDKNFENVLAEGLPLVIDFSATWCGPCQKIAPIIEQLSGDYDGRVNIYKCDVDENDELMAKYGIRNVPTVIFMDKDGNIVDKHVGVASKKDFVEKIEALI